jgi:hypothetical protein
MKELFKPRGEGTGCALTFAVLPNEYDRDKVAEFFTA